MKNTKNFLNNGNIEVLLVHHKESELKFIEDGYGLIRHKLMYNDFIIVGPKDDPAKISQENDIKNIMKKI